MLLADLGFYLLLTAAVTSLYGSLSALLAQYTNSGRLYLSSRWASFSAFAACLSACLILWALLWAQDYSVAYIYKNTSSDLPFIYRISAFWSSLEGSHLLWTLLLATFTFITHLTVRPNLLPIFPYASAALQGVLAWMYWLAITYSDPFRPEFPPKPDGLGLNALLQNPYMAIHPPILFTGYTGLAIPFAYSIAALAAGQLPQQWVQVVRNWALWAWAALTVGIFLGGRWAYVELGWAGYWAWDPVENASFMPWLITTALIHCLIIHDKLGQFKRMSLFLGMSGFFLSFFGTFLTRSGIVSSVHSFAQSPIGPSYLAYLGILAVLGLGLFAWRGPLITPEPRKNLWGMSKESALVVTQLILLFFAVVVLLGTMYPIISELVTGSRFNVQAPYFNRFAPFFGFLFLGFIPFGNLLRFQRQPMVSGGIKWPLAVLLVSLIPSLIFMYGAGIGFVDKPMPGTQINQYHFWLQVAGVILVFWSFGCLLMDMFFRMKEFGFRVGPFLRHNLSYIGSFLAHTGMMIAILGFMGNYRGMEKVVTMHAGEVTELFDYEFHFDGLKVIDKENTTQIGAPLHISRRGVPVGELFPARAKYPTAPELFHEVAILSTFWHDIYAILSDFDANKPDQATIQLHINPLVKVVWISCVIMLLGALLGLFSGLKFKMRGTLLILFALPFLFANQPNLHASEDANETGHRLTPQEIQSALDHLTPSQQTRYHSLSDQLRCPTCTGLSVQQSDTPFSMQIKNKVIEKLAEGLSDNEIITFFTSRYGLWILREPPTQGIHAILAWLIPLMMGIVAMIIGISFFRTPRK